MTVARLRRRLVVALVPLLLAPALLLVPTPTASGAGCAFPSIAGGSEPVDDGTLRVARISGAEAGEPDSWDMRYDAWICNPLAVPLDVLLVQVRHLRDGKVVHKESVKTVVEEIPAATDEFLLEVRPKSQYAFPLPDQVKVSFFFGAGDTVYPRHRTHDVAIGSNNSPVGGYFFPTRHSELPKDMYWYQGRHLEPHFQRWGYDFGVWRRTANGWSTLKKGRDGSSPSDYLSYGRRVYAMSDGEVIGCNNGAPDNSKDTKDGNVPGGNLLWVRNGNETTLYAHLRKGSIPSNLCPFTDDKEHPLADPSADPPADAAYRIKAGQYLGRTGSSGNNWGPPAHMHIHVFRGLPAIWGGPESTRGADARPLNFVNVRVHPAGKKVQTHDVDVDSAKWLRITTAKVLPYYTWFEPNSCDVSPWGHSAPEIVRRIKPGCFADDWNAMVQAGYRPTAVDFYQSTDGLRTETVWRAGNGTPWAMQWGLTTRQLRNRAAYWKSRGFQYLTLESYRDGGLRHAAIWIKKPSAPPTFGFAGLRHARFLDVVEAQVQKGRSPLSVSVTAVSGARRYSPLFVKAATGSFANQAHIPIGSYQQHFDKQKQKGRKLVYLDAHRLQGKEYFSAVWWQAGLTPVARHGRNYQQIDVVIAEQREANRAVRRIVGYRTSAGVRFAGWWRVGPPTTITQKPPASSPTRDATFAWSSTDPLLTSFECRLDTEDWHECGNGRVLTDLASGDHTMQVRAVDMEGVADPSPATWTWTVALRG